MSKATNFVLECPTCGRRLEVRVKYLGRMVVCQHCRAKFEAYDPESRAPLPSDSGVLLLQRVEELLAAANAQKAQPDCS
jgi:transcription elongation factor Elf1